MERRDARIIEQKEKNLALGQGGRGNTKNRMMAKTTFGEKSLHSEKFVKRKKQLDSKFLNGDAIAEEKARKKEKRRKKKALKKKKEEEERKRIEREKAEAEETGVGEETKTEKKKRRKAEKKQRQEEEVRLLTRTRALEIKFIAQQDNRLTSQTLYVEARQVGREHQGLRSGRE